MGWCNIYLVIWAVVSVLLIVVQESGAVTCPRDLVSAVFACFRYLQGPDEKELIVAGADLKAVNRRCGDGSFDKAVGCVKNLFHVCQYSQRSVFLQHLANTENMDEGFQTFCDNIHLYAEHKQCLVKENAGMQTCSSRYDAMLRHEMATKHGNEGQQLETVCSYLTGVTACIDLPVRRICDSTLADVLVKFMVGITPPICEPYHPGNSARSINNAFINCSYLVALISTVIYSVLGIYSYSVPWT